MDPELARPLSFKESALELIMKIFLLGKKWMMTRDTELEPSAQRFWNMLCSCQDTRRSLEINIVERSSGSNCPPIALPAPGSCYFWTHCLVKGNTETDRAYGQISKPMAFSCNHSEAGWSNLSNEERKSKQFEASKALVPAKDNAQLSSSLVASLTDSASSSSMSLSMKVAPRRSFDNRSNT